MDVGLRLIALPLFPGFGCESLCELRHCGSSPEFHDMMQQPKSPKRGSNEFNMPVRCRV